MTRLDTVNTLDKHEEGNTTTSSRSRAWCLTLNNFDEKEFDTLFSIFEKNKCSYIIGKEIDEQGTPHLQIYVRFENARTFHSLKKINTRLHIEKARGTIDENYEYCKKENNFVTNIAAKYHFSLVKFNEWQQSLYDLIMNEIKNPNDRLIHWVLDAEGAKGKTSFCKHMYFNNPNTLYVTGKANDIKYAIYCHIKEDKPLNLIVMDFTRSIENFISYEAIESIKNGIFFNGKYESGCCAFKPPIVVCFSNFEPNTDRLSSDRWNFINL